MADEWVTKMMYGYRWWFTADQKYCSRWMVHMGGGPAKRENLQQAAQMITEIQIGRLDLVGCTEQNKPIIEQSFLHLLKILEKHQEHSYFLFGTVRVLLTSVCTVSCISSTMIPHLYPLCVKNLLLSIHG
jgi:hypothetical protein